MELEDVEILVHEVENVVEERRAHVSHVGQSGLFAFDQVDDVFLAVVRAEIHVDDVVQLG